ncbi:hypothetical protein BDV12DRAFT_176987 [Aspergillus spectabilis]
MSNIPDSENGYLLNYQDQEKHRMQMQHDLIKAYMGELILAPISLDQPNLRILDSGTFDGTPSLPHLLSLHPSNAPRTQEHQSQKADAKTGCNVALWLRDAATLLKAPLLFGTDVSATAFPDPSTLPPNTTLTTQSISDPWPSDWENTFDLVHQKLVIACLPPPEGREALSRLIALAKPQTGYVQFTEGSLEHLTETQKRKFPVLARFQALVAQMLPQLGWNPRPGKLVKEWVGELGCVDVQEHVMEIPIGAANKDKALGEMAMRNMVETVGNFGEAAKRMSTYSSPFYYFL